MLDDLKKLEDSFREKIMLYILNKLKEKSKLVFELKEEVNALLDAMELDEKEKKSVIDWINSLIDVKLSDTKKHQIRERIEKDVANEKNKPDGFISSPFASTSTKASVGTITTSANCKDLTYYCDPNSVRNYTAHAVNVTETCATGKNLMNCKVGNDLCLNGYTFSNTGKDIVSGI